MSSSKSNMNTNASASATASGSGSGNKGKGKALPNGVVLPLQPKGTTKTEWPARASSSKTKADSRPPLVFGDANALAGPVRAMQLNGQASRFEPSQSQNPYMKNLLRDSEPDKSTEVVVHSGPVIVHGDGAGKGKGKAPVKETSPIGTRPPGAFAINTVFTTDVAQAFQGGHFLRIRGITDVAEWDEGVGHYHNDFDGKFESRLYDMKISEPSDLRRHVTVYLVIDDFTQAPQIIDHMPVVMQRWQVEHVSFSAYDTAPGKVCNTAKPPLHYDGQVLFVAQADNKPLDKDVVAELEKGILELASSYGKVHAFATLGGDVNQMQFRLEFQAITSAHHLLGEVNVMDPHPVADAYVVSYPYTERPTQDTDDEDDTTEASSATPHQRKTKLGGTNGITTSPTGRTAWTTGADGNYIMQKPPVVAPKIRTNRAPPQPMPPQPMHMQPMQSMAMQPMTMPLWNAANPLSQDPRYYQEPHQVQGHGGMMNGHNHGQGGQVVLYDREVRDYRQYDREVRDSRSHGWGTGPLGRVHGRRDNRNMDPNEPQSINLERLALGHDVRTTIMLRNIPNQWNYRDLKSRLDQFCAGRYDFTYLRIDFEKATNVGYGFINLTHPDHVVPFVKALVGAEWAPGMYPRKLGQISYATIQGIDCLTEKFRNSAIMSEFPDYRPKLWYTAADAPEMSMVGTEKPFPAPNNHTKTQRSHDNAGTIGLFAPRSQQRTADRSRRSNYDRGTQHQLEEEAAYAGPSYGYNNYTAAALGPVGPPPPGPYYYPAGYGMTYYQQPPPYYGYPAYGHPGYQVPHPQQWVDPYTNAVPASRLRAISQGRLAGRPQNVSVAASHIPRTFHAIEEEAAAAGEAADSSAVAEEAEATN